MRRTDSSSFKVHLWAGSPRRPAPAAGVRAFPAALVFLSLCLLLALSSISLAGDAVAPSRAGGEFGDPGARMRAYWLRGRLVVGVYPLANEGYIQIARRVMKAPENYPGIAALNRNRAIQTGVPTVFPIVSLKPVLRGHALRALYPEDELTEKGWAHTVEDPLESLIQLTEAYTGSKGRFKELARYNRISNPDVLPLGTEVVIPLHWISGELGFRPKSLRKPLVLDRDAQSGRLYAKYKVRRNDTLYSLLLRFTDRERAAELNRMAGLLLRINGIAAENRLKAGISLRIPIEWISEENRSPGQRTAKRRPPAQPAPRMLEPPRPAPPKRDIAKRGDSRKPPARAGRSRTDRKGGRSNRLHVIVDAGHGGRDPGAVYGRPGQKDHVYEHEVVNDVGLRLLQLLKRRGYRVYPTIEDPANPRPVERLSTKAFGSERVRVHPPYRITSAKVAVNMRIFLINSLYRKLTEKQGVDPGNVVLISIHGDALAPTLRGTMVYYPDKRLRVGEFQPRGRVYRIRSEGVPGRLFFRRDKNRQAERMSREFGKVIVRTFKERKLGVSRRRALRSYYYREGERTLPGVLRYSQVPTSVLVEVANLNNRHDRLAMLKGSNRQRVAAGLAAALDNLRALRQKARRIESRRKQAQLASRKAG